jgi:hypothetical protein
MKVIDPTYTKKIALEVEELIYLADNLSIISKLLSTLYEFLYECFNSKDSLSGKRIYNIILKAQKKFDEMAKHQKFDPWNGE